MPNWVQLSHHDARANFVAQMVRTFGSFCTRDNNKRKHCTLLHSKPIARESENAIWHEAVTTSSTSVKNKLQMLGVLSLNDANVAMYTCVVAVSRYNWGVRDPAASTKRDWVQEGKKLTGVDMIRILEHLPEHNVAIHDPMTKAIENVLPHVTCSLCNKPIAGLHPSKIIGRRPMRCSIACKNKENFEDRKQKRKLK